MLGRRWLTTGLLGTLGLWIGGGVALRVVLVPPETCPAITPAQALNSATLATQWVEQAQNPDGTYVYEYNRDTNTISTDYNAVRHAGVTMGLYQYAAQTGATTTLPTADLGLAWMQQHLYQRDGWSALQAPDGTIELGATGLMLAGLAQRRLATGDQQYDGLMHELARFELKLQQPDGSFLAFWLVSTGAPDPAARSPYDTGEAFWSLTLMQQAFPGEGWDKPARAVADYLSNSRDTVEHQDFPPWADQWAAYGLAQMASWPLHDNNIRYARTLAERFGFLVRVESGRTNSWLSNTLRGRESRGAGMGTWSEALDSLWRIANVYPRMADLKPKIAARAACAAGILSTRQVKPSAGRPAPDLLTGAWYRNGVTRMDDQQHTMSGLLRVRDILAPGSDRANAGASQ
jgi:hypothetical protein